MIVNVSQVSARVPVTILQVEGSIDGSNYTDLIAAAAKAYEGGARDILLDLSQVPFMSSAGIIALHRIVHVLQGRTASDAEHGRGGYGAINRQADGEIQAHFKLLKPQPGVESVLDISGLKDFFQIHSDLDQAVASF